MTSHTPRPQVACYTHTEMQTVMQKGSVVPRPVRHWGAGILSLMTPGLGQVMQDRIGRGVILSLLPIIALFTFCHSGAVKEFSGAAMLILVELLLWLIAIVDAVRYKAPAGASSLGRRLAWATVVLLGGLTLLMPPVNPVLVGNIRLFQVNGNAMTPTLMPGDWVVVSLDPWTTSPLRRGEIVAYWHHGEVLARRILGLPGDTIRFHDGRVQRNGEWLNEPYSDLAPVAGVEPAELLPVQVKNGELYVLGDARNRSVDSHTASYGAVHPADVIGRADYILWGRPYSRIGSALR